MTLRQWAKTLHFTFSGSLSSYAFTLLVIFFLQNTKPAILPSVNNLHALSGSSNLIDDCEVAFTTDISKISKSENKKSPGDLLMDFFLYYWEFDFSRNIVCPYSGTVLPIKQLPVIDDERLKNFEVTALCVQDPFILSHNVGRNMNSKLFCSFKHGLYLAIKILDKNEDCNILESLFDKEVYKKLSNEIFSPPIVDKAVSFHILSHESISFECSLDQKYIWYRTACQSLLDLLQYGLLIECEVIDKGKASNEDLIIEQVSQENNYELLMSIQCAVYNRTYVGRKKIKELPSADCDFEQFADGVLRNEFIISNHLIQQNPLLSSPEPFFWFYCDCYKSTFDRLMNINVVLTPLTISKEFKAISIYLSTFIPVNVSKMLSANIITNCA